MREFTTAPRNVEPVPFVLDGHTYRFTPPKTAKMVLPMMEASDGDAAKLAAGKAAFDWLAAGLNDEDEQLLADRLRDPNDDLDVPMINEVITWLVEQVGGGRPTGSSNG